MNSYEFSKSIENYNVKIELLNLENNIIYKPNNIDLKIGYQINHYHTKKVMKDPKVKNKFVVLYSLDIFGIKKEDFKAFNIDKNSVNLMFKFNVVYNVEFISKNEIILEETNEELDTFALFLLTPTINENLRYLAYTIGISIIKLPKNIRVGNGNRDNI